MPYLSHAESAQGVAWLMGLLRYPGDWRDSGFTTSDVADYARKNGFGDLGKAFWRDRLDGAVEVGAAACYSRRTPQAESSLAKLPAISRQAGSYHYFWNSEAAVYPPLGRSIKRQLSPILQVPLLVALLRSQGPLSVEDLHPQISSRGRDSSKSPTKPMTVRRGVALLEMLKLLYDVGVVSCEPSKKRPYLGVPAFGFVFGIEDIQAGYVRWTNRTAGDFADFPPFKVSRDPAPALTAAPTQEVIRSLPNSIFSWGSR